MHLRIHKETGIRYKIPDTRFLLSVDAVVCRLYRSVSVA